MVVEGFVFGATDGAESACWGIISLIYIEFLADRDDNATDLEGTRSVVLWDLRFLSNL